jgi:hypothetical protein
VKIGLRLGKCVLDIVKGEVLITDVLVLVINSKFNPNKDDQWAKVWDVYKNQQKTWDVGIHEEVFKYTVRRLFDMGKIHQPRTFGGREHPYTEAWIDAVPTLTKTVVPKNFVIPGKPTPPPLPKLGTTKPAPLAREEPERLLPPSKPAPFPEISSIIPDIML